MRLVLVDPDKEIEYYLGRTKGWPEFRREEDKVELLVSGRTLEKAYKFSEYLDNLAMGIETDIPSVHGYNIINAAVSLTIEDVLARLIVVDNSLLKLPFFMPLAVFEYNGRLDSEYLDDVITRTIPSREKRSLNQIHSYLDSLPFQVAGKSFDLSYFGLE